jgi:DNA-binding protein H-NS
MNLNKMDVDGLLELRDEIEIELESRAEKIKSQLLILGHRAKNGKSRKGIKVPPKYRGPNGEEWAGRGARPRWLTALVGKKGSVEKYRIKAA